MNPEAPERSFYELLVIPEGPPESVWQRALDASVAAGEQDSGDSGEFSATDLRAALEDTEADIYDDPDDEWPTGSSNQEPGHPRLAYGDDNGVSD